MYKSIYLCIDVSEGMYGLSADQKELFCVEPQISSPILQTVHFLTCCVISDYKISNQFIFSPCMLHMRPTVILNFISILKQTEYCK
jgi:hypothetical protein